MWRKIWKINYEKQIPPKSRGIYIPLARSISNVRRLIFNRRCESQLILVEAPAATPRPKETLQKRAVTTPVAPLSPTRRALLECVGAPSPLLRYDGHVTRFAPAEFADHEAFRTAFQFFDTDRDGTLSATELVEVLSRFGVNTTEENVSLMLHTMDFNGRGRVGFGEFLELMKEASGESESNMGAMDPLDDTAQRRVFESLDSDSDGFLSRDDLFKLWSMLGESEESQEENDEITAASTQDGDSKEATPTPPQSAEATSFVERMLAFADVDKDGKLSYAEFVRVIETPPESWM